MGTRTTLSRTQSVLERSHLFTGERGATVSYWQEPEPGEPGGAYLRPVVELPAELYRDLGRPEQITVTIEPGDTLNG